MPAGPPKLAAGRVRHQLDEKMSALVLWPEEFGTVFGRLFRSKPVAGDVFGHDARDEEVQQIIFATGFSPAAAHLESAEGMTAGDCTGARAIDVNIAGFELRLDAFDVGGAGRAKAAG